jgi:hypothetical protein
MSRGSLMLRREMARDFYPIDIVDIDLNQEYNRHNTVRGLTYSLLNSLTPKFRAYRGGFRPYNNLWTGINRLHDSMCSRGRMSDLEHDDEKKIIDCNTTRIHPSEYVAAGSLGCFSLFVSSIIASFLLFFLMNHFLIAKDYENILFNCIWLAFAAVPLWLSARYQSKRVPVLGWKWGLWISLPITFINIVLIPFGNLGMSMERNWIIVGTIGAAIAAFSAWYYSRIVKK